MLQAAEMIGQTSHLNADPAVQRQNWRMSYVRGRSVERGVPLVCVQRALGDLHSKNKPENQPKDALG